MFEKREVKEQVVEPVVKEKAGKPKKNKEHTDSQVGTLLKNILIPGVLAAIVVCVIFIVIQSNEKNAVVMKDVVCVKQDIPANEMIEKDLLDKYFEVISVDAAIVPENTYGALKDMPEKFSVDEKMVAKEMVADTDLNVKSEAVGKYADGSSLTSIAVSNMENGVAGTLRHGDIVDVYALDPATNQLTKMAENVYIEEAYDNAGDVITEEGSAVAFKIRVAKGEEEQINLAIAYKGIQLYKVK